MYTIMLTKAAIMHRHYLQNNHIENNDKQQIENHNNQQYEYDKIIPEVMIRHIDEKRNCEDIAMAYLIALKVSHDYYYYYYYYQNHFYFS